MPVIKVKAIPVQPGEWKLKEGIIPIRLRYPTIIGRKSLMILRTATHHLADRDTIVGVSGVVEKTGPGVTRFKAGDRILANTTGVLRNDPRFGAYQKYCLVPERFASKVGSWLGKKKSVKAPNILLTDVMYI